MSKSYSALFPDDTDKKEIASLRKIVKRCAKAIDFMQQQFQFSTLKLPAKSRTMLAELLVDFALDVHCGTGIWAALEKYNREFFGTPLPIVMPQNTDLPDGLCEERVLFFLWNIYHHLIPDTIISNQHCDLIFAAEEITMLLHEILSLLPESSPIQRFWDTSNDYGWEIKRKLIWLGTSSYLFRLLFSEYIETEYDGHTKIEYIDDFVCQHVTRWSGLGVVDILAECLDISQEQKNELRTWYLRHFSLYKITKAGKEITEAANMVNNATYRIREGSPTSPGKGYFRKGMLVYGFLVPWRGEWYWSGTQRDLSEYPQEAINQVTRELKWNTNIVCRYWPEREQQARDLYAEHHQQMLKYYGNDFIVFPDGKSWEREETKRMTAHMKSFGRMGKMPKFEVPSDLQRCRTGIGIYMSLEEGMEVMDHFNAVRSGLKKNGSDCTNDEEATIRGWMESPSISPAFVRRVLKEYGGEESIKFAYRLETNAPCCLEYMLRCHKGIYFRRRFPPISVADGDT